MSGQFVLCESGKILNFCGTNGLGTLSCWVECEASVTGPGATQSAQWVPMVDSIIPTMTISEATTLAGPILALWALAWVLRKLMSAA